MPKKSPIFFVAFVVPLCYFMEEIKGVTLLVKDRISSDNNCCETISVRGNHSCIMKHKACLGKLRKMSQIWVLSSTDLIDDGNSSQYMLMPSIFPEGEKIFSIENVAKAKEAKHVDISNVSNFLSLQGLFEAHGPELNPCIMSFEDTLATSGAYVFCIRFAIDYLQKVCFSSISLACLVHSTLPRPILQEQKEVHTRLLRLRTKTRMIRHSCLTFLSTRLF